MLKYIYYIDNKRYESNRIFDVRFNQMHREDGPAYIVYQNDILINKEWILHGKTHRDDGPAVIRVIDKFYEWWYNGECESFRSYIEINDKIKDKVLFKLKWSVYNG